MHPTLLNSYYASRIYIHQINQKMQTNYFCPTNQCLANHIQYLNTLSFKLIQY